MPTKNNYENIFRVHSVVAYDTILFPGTVATFEVKIKKALSIKNSLKKEPRIFIALPAEKADSTKSEIVLNKIGICGTVIRVDIFSEENCRVITITGGEL